MRLTASTAILYAGVQVCLITSPAKADRPGSTNWKWFTIFLSDKDSPFNPGHNLHGKDNDNDDVQGCSETTNCSYSYYGLVIAGGKAYLIDPKIIVNPNAQ